MDCRRAEQDNFVEDYLAGRLDPAAMHEWEEHYFHCDACAQKLAEWCDVQSALRRRSPGSAKAPRRRWVWAAAGIAAMLIAGLSFQRPAPQTAVSLPAIDPPNFLFPVRRSFPTQWEFQFQEAMRSYPIRDYPRTIEGLRAVVETWPDAGAPRFFLGACELLAGRTSDAIQHLRDVASGDSPFGEEARWYLANAYLREGREREAHVLLEQIIALNGDFVTQAFSLLCPDSSVHFSNTCRKAPR